MKKKHELVLFENGTASLASPETGEAMHSSIGPWEEARSIYIDQSGLADRLEKKTSEPLVIYDLGLGIATNAIAALHLQKVADTCRRMEIISFENDLGGIETALAEPKKFQFLAPYRENLLELLRTGRVNAPEFSWELRVGDFLEKNLSSDSPEAVFFDFYSPKSGSKLWAVEVFERLRAVMQKKREHEPLLLTYSAATPVRTGMLLAGFHVGRGIATEMKRETTIAALSLKSLRNPLSDEWIQRLSRSDRYAPFGIERETREAIIARVRAHPQFQRV